MTNPDTSRCRHGQAITPGLVEGMTYIYRKTPDSPGLPISSETMDADRQCQFPDRVIPLTTEKLLALATHVEREMDANLATVFDACQQICNDPESTELRTEIRENLASAGSAVKALFLRWERHFSEVESWMGQAKGAEG